MSSTPFTEFISNLSAADDQLIASIKKRVGAADDSRDPKRDAARKMGISIPAPETGPEADEHAAYTQLKEAEKAYLDAVAACISAGDRKIASMNEHERLFDEAMEQKRLEVEVVKPPTPKPTKKERGIFQADPNMKIPEKFQSRVGKVLDWGEKSRSDNFKDYLPTQAVEPRTGRPLAGYIEHLMYNIHWLGHFDSVVALGRVWSALLEQFPTWAVNYIALESSLIHDSLTKSLYVLGLHEGMDKDIDAGLAALKTYWKIFEADRLKDEKNARYKKPGPGVHGKALFHPAFSDLNAFEFRFLMWGKQEDRDAADYLTECLWDTLDFAKAPDGQEIAIPSHGVGMRYISQVGEAKYPAAHFTVYTSDSMSDLEIAALMGFKFATSRVVKALSRTLYWCYPTQGMVHEHAYARDMAGGGLWKNNKDRHAVQFRDGSLGKTKWYLSANGEVSGDYAMQRGLTYITAYRNPELPGYKQELIDLDKRALLGRHGIQQALLAWDLTEAGGRL